MILNILRWIKGYVEFVVTGKFPERFINLMNVNGIRYWNSQPCKNGFTGTMIANDYFYIRKLARSAKVKLKIRKKAGMPFFIHKYKRRKGILVGVIASVLILTILNQFIWVVNINGEEKIGEQEIRPILKKYGLNVGTLKKSVDIQRVERNTLLEIADLRWISVNMLNNVATVEIKEKDVKPSLNETYPCNIRAVCDGVITKTNVANGTTQVKVGSAVTKNQVLVNSVMTDGAESVKYVHSQAEIFADVRYEKQFCESITKDCLIPSHEFTEKTNINLLWFNFPGNFSSSDNGYKASVYNTYRLIINDVVLPLGYITEKDYYYKKELKTRDCKKILKNKLSLYELFNECDSRIKERKIKLYENSQEIAMKVDYLVNKDIAEKQKISIK